MGLACGHREPRSLGMPTRQLLDGLVLVPYASGMTKPARKKRNKFSYKGKKAQSAEQVEAKKPIDLWLALAGTSIGIALFLLPEKSATGIVFWCVLFFALLCHPLWNFWWIERSTVRRVCGVLLLLAGTVGIAFKAWPRPITVSPETISVGSSEWSVYQEITVTNHEEAPRFGITLVVNPSNSAIDYSVEPMGVPRSPIRLGNDPANHIVVDSGFMALRTTDGTENISINRIGPKESIVYRVKAKHPAGSAPGNLSLSVNPGNTSSSGQIFR